MRLELGGAPDLSLRFAGIIGGIAGGAAFILAVREFMSYAVEFDQSFLSLIDQDFQRRTVAYQSIETLDLRTREGINRYELQAQISDSEQIVARFLSSEQMEQLFESIGRHYPDVTLAESPDIDLH